MKVGPPPAQQRTPGTTGTGSTLGGDVGGTLPGGVTVVGIDGSPISGTSGADMLLVFDGSEWVYTPRGDLLGNATGQFIAGFDGGGSALLAAKEQDVIAPFDGTITGWTLLADAVGSAVVDVWLTDYATFAPGVAPTVADSITGSAPPTLTAAAKNTSTALTGWTTAVAAGDILRFHLTSVATITRLLLVIDYSRP